MSGRRTPAVAASVLVAVTIAVVLGATSPARSAETRVTHATGCTSSKGTLRYGIAGAGIAQLDPNTITFAGQPPLQTLLYNGLTKYDRTMKVVPDLATQWRHSADLKTWWFTLRHGVKYANGRAFTPADVVATTSCASSTRRFRRCGGPRQGHPLGPRDQQVRWSASSSAARARSSRTRSSTSR